MIKDDNNEQVKAAKLGKKSWKVTKKCEEVVCRKKEVNTKGNKQRRI